MWLCAANVSMLLTREYSPIVIVIASSFARPKRIMRSSARKKPILRAPQSVSGTVIR